MLETQESSAAQADLALRRQVPHLFDISENIRMMVDAAIDDETGEIDSSKFAAVLFEKEDFKEVALGVGLVIEEIKGDADKVKAAIAALKLREGFFKNRAERLKSSLYEAMVAQGYDSGHKLKEMRKITGTLVTLTMAKGIEVVKILDEDEIPEDYYKIPEPALVKKDIMTALKEGTDVPGTELRRNPQSLRIKLDTT